MLYVKTLKNRKEEIMDKQTIVALNNSTKQSLELANKALNSAKTEADVLEAKKAYDSALAEREQVVNQIIDFGLSASDPQEAKKTEALNSLHKIKEALKTQNFAQNDIGEKVTTPNGQRAALPVYVSTKIIERARDFTQLSKLMTVVNVSQETGHEAIEPASAITPLSVITPGQPVPEQKLDDLIQIDYSIKDYGQLVHLYRSVLDDTDQNFYNHLVDLFAKKMALSENAAFYNIIKDVTAKTNAKATAKDIVKLTTDVNLGLLGRGAFFMNKSTYNELVGVTKGDGKMLVEDPLKEDGTAVIAGYPAHISEDYSIGNNDKVIYFGDFTSLVRKYDRQSLSVGAQWNPQYNTNDILPIFRADYVKADEDAVKALKITTVSSDPIATIQGAAQA